MILFHERLDASKALAWGVAQTLSEHPLSAALELAQTLGPDQSLARTLAKTLIDARAGGGGGGREEGLRAERVAEGLLYEAKHQPRAVICGLGLAAPDEVYTQRQVADLLGVRDPRMRCKRARAPTRKGVLPPLARPSLATPVGPSCLRRGLPLTSAGPPPELRQTSA